MLKDIRYQELADTLFSLAIHLWQGEPPEVEQRSIESLLPSEALAIASTTVHEMCSLIQSQNKMENQLKEIFPTASARTIQGIMEDLEYQSESQIRFLLDEVCDVACDGIKTLPNLSETTKRWIESIGSSERNSFASLLQSIIGIQEEG